MVQHYTILWHYSSKWRLSPVLAQWPLSGSNEDKDFTLGFCFLIIYTQPQHHCWQSILSTATTDTRLIADTATNIHILQQNILKNLCFEIKFVMFEQKEPFWHKAANVLVTSIELGIVGDNISPSLAGSNTPGERQQPPAAGQSRHRDKRIPGSLEFCLALFKCLTLKFSRILYLGQSLIDLIIGPLSSRAGGDGDFVKFYF